MNYRQIIAEAWEFTQNNKKMTIWYAFFPALLTTVAGIIYLTYQYFAFLSSPLFENWDHGFLSVLIGTILQWVRENFSSAVPLIVIAAILGLFYLFFPPVCEGGLIQLIARKKNGQEIKTRNGIKYGMLYFLPLFEYSTLLGTFSLVSIFGEGAFVARNLGWEAFKTLSPIFIVFLLVGIVLTVLFSYTQFFIVIDDRKVFESIVKSCGLVIRHLEETLLLSILMIIISIRILVQIGVVILIPAVILTPIYFFASSALPEIGIVLGGVLGLIALYLASYLNGIIHVFAATVWTFTFLELTRQQEVSARDKVE